jgi:histone acetyltransferase HTATIP
MGGHGGNDDDKPALPPILGKATLSTLRPGVKAMVKRENGEYHKAEIVQIGMNNKLVFYVHWDGYNKRLDEWVAPERLNLEEDVEWPQPEKPEKTTKEKKKRPGGAGGGSHYRDDSVQPETNGHKEPSKAGRKTPGDHADTPGGEDGDLVDVVETAATVNEPSADVPVEDEIEKLRTSGSMTQNQTEIARVRNLNRVQMGKFEMIPWYFSPYPQEFTTKDMVYICEFCLSHYGDEKPFIRHRQKCTLLHPPGNEIYRDDNVSFFEIDGRKQRTWCRSLCLLSKLFLDHKSVYFDVDPFLFYCMTTRDEYGCHLVGYFSKEKESLDGYNVACILTLPQYQRKGFGKLLIEFSYELSKRESKLGSPEKPLSDLGLLSYRAYWQETLTQLLLEMSEVSIEQLSSNAAMTTQDVIHTLTVLGVLRYVRGSYVLVLTKEAEDNFRAMRKKQEAKGRRFIDPEKLIWKPPVFTASSRTWNW